MVNICPNCGTEVKEDFKFCLGCGQDLTTVNFAENQPNDVETSLDNSQLQAHEPINNNIQSQQQIDQNINYNETDMTRGPRKSNMKLFLVLFAVIIAVIVILVVVFIGLGGGSDGRFIGTWEYTEPTSGMTVGYKFNGDGSLEVTTDFGNFNFGKWRVNGDQLCLEPDGSFDMGMTGFIGEQCTSYSFLNNGTQLSINSEGTPLVLTKK